MRNSRSPRIFASLTCISKQKAQPLRIEARSRERDEMEDIRVFLSHTSDLDAPSDGPTNFVGAAIRSIAALPGFSVEEQTTTFTAEDQAPVEVCRRRLAGCDVYVGIIGYARGTLVDGDPAGRSFVE